jgi:hypothetical protein
MYIKLIVLVSQSGGGHIDGVREQHLRIWAKESRTSGIVEMATY